VFLHPSEFLIVFGQHMNGGASKNCFPLHQAPNTLFQMMHFDETSKYGFLFFIFALSLFPCHLPTLPPLFIHMSFFFLSFYDL
jgi:hypothetical protein